MPDREKEELYENPAASAVSRSHNRLKWEIVGILAMVFVLNLFIFVFLFDDKDKTDSAPNRPEQEITVKPIWAFLLENENHQHNAINDLMRVGNTQLARNHLTWPNEANALSTFLALRELHGGERQATLGIKKIADRYLQHLNRLRFGEDSWLLTETLASAKQLIPHVNDHTYTEALNAIELDVQEIAHKLTVSGQAIDSQREALSVFYDTLPDGTPGPAMVVIPSGEFLMSSPDDELGRDIDEGAQRIVNVKRFAVSETEISFAQYKQFVDATGGVLPDDNGWSNDGLPVVNISWKEAKAYTRWLRHTTGFYYRLPAEAEWEYAARAGIKTPFISGKCMLHTHANFDGGVAYSDCILESSSVGQVMAVKALQPNDWGLYHVQGNVREWVEDCWISGSSYYPRADGKALYGAEGGGCKEINGKRVIRGGSWKTSMQSIRLANRYAVPEDESDNETGFRVARQLYNPASFGESDK